ncbi:MAG: hypothetical protein HGB20_05495 [Chlorobiaceae bacterium]|nr:hypothetical protein [Chlorobiaceae bacterium]
MHIPLNRFDEYIDDTMPKRGLAYFRKGKVHEPEETGPGKYKAVVEGTETYTVKLVIANGTVTEHLCSCPYDMGPVCKHVAAVLFHLQQDTPGMKKKPARTGTSDVKKPSKRKTVAERIDEALDSIGHEELQQFVREQATVNIPFRNILLASFAGHGSDESKGSFVTQLQSILRSAKDRTGFISWSTSNRVAEAVSELLRVAQKHLDSHNYPGVISICTAIMEQMVAALQYSDDSDGSIGNCIHTACDMLFSIAESAPQENIRKLLLDYCLKAVHKKLYSGWDWHVSMLRMAAQLAVTDKEIEDLTRELDGEKGSDYTGEETQDIMFGLIARTKGMKAAEAYLETHLVNPKLRRRAIQLAMERSEFSKAASLARDGIEYDRKDRPGLVDDWYDWLLKIAQAQGDREAILQYARKLFIENFRPAQDYYAILKQQVEPEMWVRYAENLVAEIAGDKKYWHSRDLIAAICIREGWVDRLLQLVSESPDLHTISQYESVLAEKHSAPLVALYADAVAEYLVNHIGRNHYQHACRYLRRMVKLGGRGKTNELILALRSKYPQRKALMEELDKV